VKLTISQKRAVEHPLSNLQLIACAGSGKTEVVARRVVHLLTPGRSESLVPRNIIAFTFTEKAAAELKERIVTRTRQALGEMPGMAEMFVGTIHAFCLELLKSESPKYLKYEVLNEVQQTLFVDRHSKASGLTQSATLTKQALRRYVDTATYISALSILREDKPIAPRQLAGNVVVANLPTYAQLLDCRGYLDYSGILKAAADELRDNGTLRSSLAERIRCVIVDEYQDVNPIQERIVSLLHQLGASLCVVGDDDQTIYQWRGSDVRNILTFDQRYANATQVKLEENFRSSEGVVAVARDFIRQLVQRLPKEMKATQAQPFEAGDIVALGFDSPEDEALYIAETCRSLLGVAIEENGTARGMAWSDMAILLRSVRRDAGPITGALAAAKIPYVITGMDNLFANPPR
jgi:DNA helicase-2/ATP-dependent DNA helicase PcrA